MRFGVLGPLAVWTDDGAPVPVPGLKVRTLLADLLVHDGQPVSADRLVDDLWGDAVPANPTGALQVRVSQLRKALDDAEPGARDLVASRPPGYALQASPDNVDARQFAALASRAEASTDPRTRADLLGKALALWRGPAYADFADEEFTRTAIARLAEQRLSVLEQHAEARLELGEPVLLDDLVTQHPLRERLRAVHMRALYRAGRQSEALDSYHDLRRRLADELGLDPGPDLAAVYKAILEQDPALTRPSTNLPEPLTDLIGRDEAIAAIRSRLASARLVTLTGSGGVGKTRLATAVARTLIDSFADGVWLVELAAAAPAADPAELVMAVLDIRDERLVAALRNRKTLLVLDNCEHLVEQVASLAGMLLRTAPGLRILATSREPLGVDGEVVWDVPPLSNPDAVRLFEARASAAARGFTVDSSNGELVGQLCRRLDGIPLALELAATRVRTLGVQGLVDRLDDRFRLLTGGHRGAPPRQQTLTAVIDWSWQLLTEPERTVLRRLAVHADGSTVESAAAVCAGSDVLDLLARLVNRSLVVLDDRGPRYRLLESVAAFCMDRMRDAGELDEVRHRHAQYYVDLAEQASHQLYGGRQREWLKRLDADAANMRAALDTLVDSGASDQALRLVNSLAWYWILRGRPAEARRSLAAALALPGSGPLRARALAWQAGIAVHQGDPDGPALCHAALERVADPRAEWFLGSALSDLGDLAAGEKLVDQAMARFRADGDRWGEAAAESSQAKLAHVRGDHEGVGRHARRSAELFGELGDDWGMLQATDWLIGVAEMTGDYEQATRLARDGLRMAEELGLWPDAANRLAWLGWIAVEVGDYASAREWCEQALRLATEQGFQSGEVFARIGLAFAARRDGKLDLAEELLRDLIATARRSSPEGDALYLSMVLVELGLLAEHRGDSAAALALHLEGFDVARRQDAQRDVAWALEGMASALAALHPDRASLLLGAATAARRATGLPASPAEREAFSRLTARLRSALSAAEYATLVARGEELTPSDARSLADKS